MQQGNQGDPGKNSDANRTDWAWKLDEAIWAYKTDLQTPICMTPYQLVFEKECPLPIEIEH